MKSFGRKTVLIAATLYVQIIALAGGVASAQEQQRGPAYSFVYLGDIHFDTGDSGRAWKSVSLAPVVKN